MIISCPQCDMRYDVPVAAFSGGSRKMKCASCAHVWVQEELLEKNDAPFKAMLDRARDSANASKADQNPQVEEKENLLQTILLDFREGMIVIALTCAVVIAGYVGISMMLSPALIYGQGLAFNDMKVERSEGGVIVTGEIVNSMKDPRGVPALNVVELMAHDMKGDEHVIAPPVDILQGGSSVPVKLSLPHIGKAVMSVHVTFGDGAVEPEAIENSHDHMEENRKEGRDAHHDEVHH